MFCPECRAEYVDGIERCATCDVDLVDASTWAAEERPRQIRWTELTAVATEVEAELVHGYLENEGVPCQLESLVFHAEPVNFGPLARVRVHVPSERVEEARKLLDQLSDETVTAVP